MMNKRSCKNKVRQKTKLLLKKRALERILNGNNNPNNLGRCYNQHNLEYKFNSKFRTHLDTIP